MRAFGGADKDDAAPDGDAGDAPRRVVSLKKKTDGGGGGADDASPRAAKRSRDAGDTAAANGEEAGEPRKRGVRGRGAATYQSSVVAAVDDGPRRDPPEADPTRVLKVRPPRVRGRTSAGARRVAPMGGARARGRADAR
jgi:hypothetical protein